MPDQNNIPVFKNVPILKPEWYDSECGNCLFFLPIRGYKKTILTEPTPHECRESPPHMLFVMQSTPQGQTVAQITPTYPRYGDNFPACSKFSRKVKEPNMEKN